MRAVLLIAGKELATFFKSFHGYLIVAVLLLVDGMLFHALAMGQGERLSSTVLQNFFMFTFGCTFAGGVLLSMRLLAEETHDGTVVLLFTAPISDWQITLGKWLSSFLFLCVFIVLSAYLPAMVLVNGSASTGHIAAGYLGLVLAGATASAIGVFASSLTRSQVVAAVVGIGIAIGLTVMWWLAKRVDPPFDAVFAYMALYDKHFGPSFAKGAIHTRDIVFYLSLTFFALLATRQVLGARRWR